MTPEAAIRIAPSWPGSIIISRCARSRKRTPRLSTSATPDLAAVRRQPALRSERTGRRPAGRPLRATRRRSPPRSAPRLNTQRKKCVATAQRTDESGSYEKLEPGRTRLTGRLTQGLNEQLGHPHRKFCHGANSQIKAMAAIVISPYSSSTRRRIGPCSACWDRPTTL